MAKWQKRGVHFPLPCLLVLYFVVMTISRTVINLVAVGIIWLFTFWNRINILEKAEIVRATVFEETEYYLIVTFDYKGETFSVRQSKEHFPTSEPQCRILLFDENFRKIQLYSFLGFWMPACIIAVYLTMVWFIFMQAFFERVTHFVYTKDKPKT